MAEGSTSVICLVRIKSGDSERVHVIGKSPFLMGRSQECDLVLADSSLSRKHVQFEFSESGVFLEDQSSSNGSYIETQKVKPLDKTLVPIDSFVKLGTCPDEIRFQILPRPLEMEDLESQRQSLRSNLKNVIQELQTYARNEIATELEKDAAEKKEQIYSNLQAAAEKEFSDWSTLQRKAITDDLEKMRNSLTAELDLEFVQKRIALENELSIQKLAYEKENQRIRDELQDLLEKERAQRVADWEVEKTELLKRYESEFQSRKEVTESEMKTAFRVLDQEKRRQKAELEDELKAHKAQVQTERDALNEELTALRKFQTEQWSIEKSELIEGAKAQALIEQQKIIQNYSQEVLALVEKKEELEQVKNSLKNLADQQNRLHFDLESINHEISLKKSQLEELLKENKESEGKATQILKDAYKRSQDLEHSSTEKSNQLLRETQGKLFLMNQEAQAKAEQIRRGASEKADRIIEGASLEAATMRTQALAQTERMIEDARRDGQRLVEELKQKMEAEVQAERNKILEIAMSEARLAQKEIIDNSQGQISDLQEAIKSNQQNLMDLTDQILVREKSIADLHHLQSKLESEHSSLSGNLQVLKNEFKKNSAELEEARAALDKKRALETEILKLEKSLTELRGTALGEEDRLKNHFKTLNEELVLKYEADRRQADIELSQHKLKGLEDFKRKIAGEENQIVMLRKSQASEFAKTIQMKVVEKVGKYIAESDKLGRLSQDIYEEARATLGQDISSFKATTLHLEEKRQVVIEKNKKRIKPILFISASAVVVAVFFNFESLMQVFKSKSEDNLAKHMIEQRRIQSIFQPEQTREWRANYTDNVLYNKYYAKVKLSPDYQRAWSLKLNDLEVIKALKVSEDKMVRYQAAQNALVKNLIDLRVQIDALYKDEGIARLSRLEATERERMAQIFDGVDKVTQLESSEKVFFQTYVNAHANLYP